MEKENRQIKKSEKLLMQLIAVRIKRLTHTSSQSEIFFGGNLSPSRENLIVFSSGRRFSYRDLFEM